MTRLFVCSRHMFCFICEKILSPMAFAWPRTTLSASFSSPENLSRVWATDRSRHEKRSVARVNVIVQDRTVRHPSTGLHFGTDRQSFSQTEISEKSVSSMRLLANLTVINGKESQHSITKNYGSAH